MIIKAAMILSLAAGCVLTVRADVLYTTGFESPTFTTGPVSGQNGWSVFGTSSAVQVEDFFAESGSQAVDVIPSLASGQTGPYYGLSTTAPEIELSADIYLASSSAQSAWQFAALGPGLNDFIGGINISNTGAITVQSTSAPAAGTFTYNAWQSLDFVFDFTTQTYSFSLDGSLIGSSIPFCGSDSGCTGANIPSFGDVLFDVFPAGGANDIGYMDNVTISSVSTPEPGSLLLLATCAAAALIALRVRAGARA